MSGPRQIVVDDIKTIIPKSEELSLELNAAKCEVTYDDSSTPHDDPILKSIQCAEMDDLTLFGAPILPGRAVDKALEEKIEKLEKAMSRLHLLQSHDDLNLLRNSISVPKLLYTLRTSECSDNPEILKFDKLQRKCITDVINININDIQWTQATLPVKDGGLGIRSVTVLAPSAFLASAASTLRIQNDILLVRLHIQVDSSKVRTIDAWKKLTQAIFQLKPSKESRRNGTT